MKLIAKKFLPIFNFFNFDVEKFLYSINKLDLKSSTTLPKNKTTINNFSKLYYDQGKRGGTWNDTYFLGVKTMKNPLDLWIYQEMIFRTLPDVIIETGTAFGGSALFLASILDLIGKGKVLTVDVYKQKSLPKHKRIKYVNGSSVDNSVVSEVRKFTRGKRRVMVILDSDHSFSHVKRELAIYSKFVTAGNYLIVEDTNINGHPVYEKYGPGPFEAVKDFTSKNSDFVIDRYWEKFLVTSSPGGFLKRV